MQRLWFGAMILLVLLGSDGAAQPPEDNTAEGLRQLAKEVNALRAQGKTKEALPLAQRLAAAALRVPGADPKETASHLALAGQVYSDAGQYAQAEPLYQRSLAMLEDLLGNDHLDVARSLFDLGWVYSHPGQYAKAEPLFQRALQIREAKLGKDHPEVAHCLQGLAWVYYHMGQHAKAEPLHQRALEIREAKLGKDHPDVAHSLFGLASLHRSMSRYAQAEPLFLRALQIWEAKLGKDHHLVALCVNSLAGLYRDQGRYDQAELLLQRGLQIREAKLGKDHPDVATSFNDLAWVYSHMGQYAKAEPLFLRGLQIREAKLGKDHLDVGHSLFGLASLYRSTGRYAQAEPLFLRALQIWETKLGKDHLLVALCVNSLAGLYRDLGRYDQAEPVTLRALQIREAKLGKDHPDVATSLNDLVWLYQRLGQYAKAELLFLHALRIREAKLGKDHPTVGHSLFGLAVVYRNMGRYAQAEPLFLRSLQIWETKLGRDHPYIAINVNSLASLYRDMGQYAQAEALFQRAIQINEAKFGKDHPEVALNVNTLAGLYQLMGQQAKAELLSLRALQIREAKLGKDHPDVAVSLRTLASVYEPSDRTAEAADLTDRSRRISRRHVALILPALSPAEQADFLRRNDEGAWYSALSLGLRHAASDTLTARSAAWLLNGKAVAHQTAAQTVLLARDSTDPQLGDQARRLAELRQRLAHLTLATPETGKEQDRQRQLEQLQAQEAELAKRLHQGGSRGPRPDLWIELDEVRKRLPADAAFIDIARFGVWDFKANRWQPARYAAWITRAEGPVRLIDLGPAQAIDEAVKALRQALTAGPKLVRQHGEPDAEATLRQPLEKLAGLVLTPLLPHVGTVKRWLVSPDGNLWLVPWAALPLPNGKYAIEEHSISYLVSGRDLLHRAGAVQVQPTRPLVLADPDFDLGVDKVVLETRRLLGGREAPPETRGLSRALQLGQIPRLPGTAAEAEAVVPRLQQYAGLEPQLRSDHEALAGVFQAVKHPRVVLLSTHGYFLPDQEVAVKDKDHPEPDKPALRLENPLLRCGLLLAGCNHAGQAKEGEDNGVLTGLQIVGTDLRGCELVVLSACETGLGEVRNGEGVAGLRQAFQLAGAQSVVATLWQVPDQQSAQLMIRFFDNLAAKQSKADALRNAQLALIKARRDRNAAAHPFFWAAFTLTGQ